MNGKEKFESPQYELPEEMISNDLRLTESKSGGFISVKLYDADDHNSFILSEDDIKPLWRRLEQIVAEQGL